MNQIFTLSISRIGGNIAVDNFRHLFHGNLVQKVLFFQRILIWIFHFTYLVHSLTRAFDCCLFLHLVNIRM